MRLADWLSETNTDLSTFAVAVGISHEGARLLKLGKRQPRPETARKIAEVTNGAVMPNDFVLPAEGEAA